MEPIRILVTGGTFDKEYNELTGELFFQGTHTGDMMSPEGTIPASGNKIDLRFADYFKVAGGRVTDHRTYWDQMQMMGQLGAGPPQ